MDRAISVEERIKRAEEIYNRRNGNYINTSKTKKEKKKKSTAKRLIMQIVVCLMIYLAYYVFTNSDYIFSEEFLNQVRSVFSQDSKIYTVYLDIKTFIKDKILTNNEQTVESQTENEVKNEVKNEINDQVKDESIGGSTEDIKQNNNEENKENYESNQSKEDSQKSQMEKDADSIKKKISFIVPVQGKISSTFGWRNPTTNNIPKYHTGLDIAANEGTIIKSATDGKIILVSSEGSYGKHYKIQNGDVIIIYAHCSKLYLKEGKEVKKGDKIAEVGSTGNSTGPHLHFEIRKEERLIDPQLILDI